MIKQSEIINNWSDFINTLKIVKKNQLYELYEGHLNDMNATIFKPLSTQYEPLVFIDNDYDVVRTLEFFDEELKLKTFLFNERPNDLKDIKMEISDNKVIVYLGEKVTSPDKIKKMNVRWNFLFKYKVPFKHILLKTEKNKGMELEIPGEQYVNAIYTILSQKSIQNEQRKKKNNVNKNNGSRYKTENINTQIGRKTLGRFK